MSSRSPITLRVLASVFAAVLIIVGVNQISPIGATDEAVLACEPAVDEALSSGAVMSIYGEHLTCTASGGGAVAILWPDGARTGLDEGHIPDFVGEGSIDLLDEDDVVLVSTAVRVEPDISLECTDRDGDLKKIFELEATDLRSTGWDYVFTDLATGELVRPGDPLHPNGGSEEGLERVLLGEAQSTGLCRVISEAAEAFEGEYRLTLDSPWEPSQSTPMRIIGPSSKTQWAGTQPAEVTGTVTVNNITASERANVYQSGCS